MVANYFYCVLLRCQGISRACGAYIVYFGEKLGDCCASADPIFVILAVFKINIGTDASCSVRNAWLKYIQFRKLLSRYHNGLWKRIRGSICTFNDNLHFTRFKVAKLNLVAIATVPILPICTE